MAATLISFESCTFIKVSKNFNIESDKGETVTKEYDVKSLNQLTFDSRADVIFEISETPYIRATASQNVIDNIIVNEDRDGVVWIRMAEKHIRYKDLKLEVGTPEISRMVFNGAVDFENKGKITGSNIMIETNGASDLNIDDIEVESLTVAINGASDLDIKKIEAKDVDITVNGAGDIKLQGQAERSNIQVNGAGDIDIENFECPDMRTNSSGFKRLRK